MVEFEPNWTVICLKMDSIVEFTKWTVFWVKVKGFSTESERSESSKLWKWTVWIKQIMKVNDLNQTNFENGRSKSFMTVQKCSGGQSWSGRLKIVKVGDPEAWKWTIKTHWSVKVDGLEVDDLEIFVKGTTIRILEIR